VYLIKRLLLRPKTFYTTFCLKQKREVEYFWHLNLSKAFNYSSKNDDLIIKIENDEEVKPKDEWLDAEY